MAAVPNLTAISAGYSVNTAGGGTYHANATVAAQNPQSAGSHVVIDIYDSTAAVDHDAILQYLYAAPQPFKAGDGLAEPDVLIATLDNGSGTVDTVGSAYAIGRAANGTSIATGSLWSYTSDDPLTAQSAQRLNAPAAYIVTLDGTSAADGVATITSADGTSVTSKPGDTELTSGAVHLALSFGAAGGGFSATFSTTGKNGEIESVTAYAGYGSGATIAKSSDPPADPASTGGTITDESTSWDWTIEQHAPTDPSPAIASSSKHQAIITATQNAAGEHVLKVLSFAEKSRTFAGPFGSQLTNAFDGGGYAIITYGKALAVSGAAISTTA